MLILALIKTVRHHVLAGKNSLNCFGHGFDPPPHTDNVQTEADFLHG